MHIINKKIIQMKKGILSLVSFISVSLSFSQSLQIELGDGTNVSGQCVEVAGSEKVFEIVEDFTIRNTSGTDKVVFVKRTELDVNCSTTHAVCWGVCPPATNSCSEIDKTSGLSQTITAGGTNNSLAGHHYPDYNVGYSIYRYTAFVDGDPTDNAYVDVVFEHGASNPSGGCVLSLKNHKKIDMLVSPNPATSKLNVAFYDGKNYEVQLINILGKVVLQKKVISSSNIDVSGLDRGVYFVKISDANGNTVNSKKIVLE
jgi:hypothetical protein